MIPARTRKNSTLRMRRFEALLQRPNWFEALSQRPKAIRDTVPVSKATRDIVPASKYGEAVPVSCGAAPASNKARSHVGPKTFCVDSDSDSDSEDAVSEREPKTLFVDSEDEEDFSFNANMHRAVFRTAIKMETRTWPCTADVNIVLVSNLANTKNTPSGM